MFESCENMIMNAAILCPAGCVSDVTKQASVCGKKYKL